MRSQSATLYTSAGGGIPPAFGSVHVDDDEAGAGASGIADDDDDEAAAARTGAAVTQNAHTTPALKRKASNLHATQQRDRCARAGGHKEIACNNMSYYTQKKKETIHISNSRHDLETTISPKVCR